MNPHAVVTTPRHRTGVTVSEYVCADERGRSAYERAQAMISVAHPDIRDELFSCAELLGR